MVKAISGVAVLLLLVVIVINAVINDAWPMGPPLDPVGAPRKAKSTLPLLGGFLWPRGPTSTWGDEPLNESFARAKEAGMGLAIWTYNWGELETKPNHFDWAWLDFLVNQTVENGLKVSLSFEIAQPHRPPVYPPDIKEARFDDPVFEARLLALYERLARRYKEKVNYLWVGQEYDALLHLYPEHKKPFIALMKKIRARVKAIDPKMRFGLVAGYHLAKFYGYEKTLLVELAKVTDLIGFTLYVEDEKNLTDPTQTGRYFDEMISLFPNNKIFIHETAWSSNGPKGSPERQAEYVRQLGKVAAKYQDKIEALSWWVIHDFAKGDSRNAAEKYGAAELEGFMDWHDSVGLIDTTGREKLGWQAWMDTMLEK